MKRIFALFLVFIIFNNCVSFADESFDENLELTDEEIAEVTNMSGSNIIRAKAALAYDITYNKILYSKNMDEKLPNASTTKILTAIVAYENSNMNDVVLVSQNAARVGGSTINLKSGDEVILGDLMKGLLICSGNDAAVAIAEHVGGSVEHFCSMMNNKAAELGAKNTHFVTPHGLDNDEHYTTASDLAILSSYLLKIPYLASIVDIRSTTIKINDQPKDIRTTNEILGIYSNAHGVKTGITGKAGRCLITEVSSGDRDIITVVLGCDTKKQRTLESIWLINYSFREFEEVDIYEKADSKFKISVDKSTSTENEVEFLLKKVELIPNGSKENIRYLYDIKKNLVAPVKKDEIIGKIYVYIDDNLIDMEEIKIPYEIKRKSVFDYVKELLKDQTTYFAIVN